MSADEAALRREVLTSVRELIARDGRTGELARWSPAALVSELRIGRNLACSLLEELEANGELVRYHAVPGLWWLPAPASQPVGRGYALPLSQREASALMRLLDVFLTTHRLKVEEPQLLGDLTILREVRSRLKGGPL